MTSLTIRVLRAAAVTVSLCVPAVAHAQDSGSPLSVFQDMFGSKRKAETPPQTSGQATPDQVVRIEQLEQQLRQMTGTIEELRYRNQQLEAQIRGMGQAPNGASVQSQPMRPPGQGPV